jgi:hypothetical protein
MFYCWLRIQATDIWVSHSGITEDSNILEWGAVSLDEWFFTLEESYCLYLQGHALQEE